MFGFYVFTSQFSISRVPIIPCFFWIRKCFPDFYWFLGIISFMFFSACLLAIIIWCPQPIHFNRKSAPTLSTSHSLEPHGCCFFSFKISPTWISILILISAHVLCAYRVCACAPFAHILLYNRENISPMLPCTIKSAMESLGVGVLLTSTSLFHW